MTRASALIDRDPEVRRIASALKIVGPDLQAKLCAAAMERVERTLHSLGIEPATLAEMHSFVLNMTGVQVVRLESDEDLKRVSVDYAKKLPLLPVQLELEFGSNTEALVFRQNIGDPRRAKFTAVVDARGDRRRRAWFAERHEPAHLLVPDDSARVAWRRTTAERPEPVEQVVDAIAGRIGFWESIVRPVLSRALREEPDVLGAFERARAELAPEASLESCFRAFSRLVPQPLVLVWSEYASRAADVRAESAAASGALRARVVISNDAATASGLFVPRNYRIPPESVIRMAHASGGERTFRQDDDLGRWGSSRGTFLRPYAVRIVARGRWAAIEAP